MRFSLWAGLIALPINALTPTVLAAPEIKGTPEIVTPSKLLDWPADFPGVMPFLTEPTSNRLHDLHGAIENCDIVLSTSGNYHMALRELWQVYLSQYAHDLDIKTWYYTTSPPIAPEQVAAKTVQFGNLNLNCVPQVAVGPAPLIKRLIDQGDVVGEPVDILKNYGNVILVKKGNPKHIRTVWDLGRPDVTLVTPNPEMEPGSFNNFSSSIYDIAVNDPNPPEDSSADTLFDSIFNQNQANCGNAPPCAWVSGKRIMHREQPWAISAGKADASVIFYHLALYFIRTFPEQFEIVPLGGSIDHPQPLAGNRVAILQAARIRSNWNEKQVLAQAKLIEAFQSEAFTAILVKHGLRRP